MTLMFDKQKVDEATHPLVRILRTIFYEKKITLDDFSTLYAKHGKRVGFASHETNTNRNNARKALSRNDEITFRLFQYILLNVLYLDFTEFSTTVYDQSTKQFVTYKYNITTGKSSIDYHSSDQVEVKEAK